MGAMASQITSLTIVCSCVYSRRRSKKTSKLRVTGLCEGNSTVTGEFPSQRASNAENVSIWWRHHVEEFSLERLPDLFVWIELKALRDSKFPWRDTEFGLNVLNVCRHVWIVCLVMEILKIADILTDDIHSLYWNISMSIIISLKFAP